LPRYAHISALRAGAIYASLLAMEAVVSYDSVRCNLGKLDEADGVAWLQNHLDACVALVLGVPWILDTDVTVKPLYGHQEGALKGYIPHKPGRPMPKRRGWRRPAARSQASSVPCAELRSS